MRIIILILLIFFSFSGFGQEGAYDGPRLIYSNQFSAGGHIATAGWGVQGYLGKYDGYYKIKLKGIELVKLKHPREKKRLSDVDNSKRYTYGKTNSFQTVRLLFGTKKIITDKLRHGAVAIGYQFTGGFSLGVLKPIYVEVLDLENLELPSTIERYDSNTDGLVIGRANFLNGLNKMSLVPGAVLKASLTFEYSGDDGGIQQLEAGVSLDGFLEEVPVMFEEIDNQQFFPAIFISYSLGKKYVKR